VSCLTSTFNTDLRSQDPSLFGLLVGLLRKLDPENQVAETVAVHALACASSICAVCVRDESKALGTSGFAVLGQEDAGDAAVALEDFAEVVFFGEFGDLGDVLSVWDSSMQG
jgi:hypothetical protein